jgi:5-methyltetrahydrofolate--homocysteine methyltransferase
MVRMTTWKKRLEKKTVMIADGGWGTELIKQGLKPGEVAETWNIDRPEEVRSVAASYVEAGADIILTNTFGGSPLKLSKEGLEARMAEINRLGAKISKEAAGQNAFVFGSMGPIGELMAPLGEATEAEMVKCFTNQAIALAAGGVDGIVIETMMDLGEAKAALRAVREGTSLPVVVSLTFNKHRSGYATLMGVRPEQAAVELERAGADVIGTNCGAGIDDMIEVARVMHRATSLPIWCKPNAGLPEFVDGNTVYRETPERMASKLGAIVEAGARIVGGCCGTTPRHIQAFVQERDRLAK